MNAISAHRVSVTYRPLGSTPHQAIRDVSFEVLQGTNFGLVGANGAGKTTLLRSVAGLIQPNTGELRVLGLDPVRQRTKLMRRMGVLLSGKRHFPERWSVRDVLMYSAALYQVKEAQQRVRQIAEEFQLDSKLEQQVITLSLGNQQRLSLAVTFIHNPELALLDEPTLALDVHSVERFLQFLQARAAQGMTTLITSHDHAMLGRLAQQLVILERGCLAGVDAQAAEQVYARLWLKEPIRTPLPDPVQTLAGGYQLRLPLENNLLGQVCSILHQEANTLQDMRTERGFEALIGTVPLQPSAMQEEEHAECCVA